MFRKLREVLQPVFPQVVTEDVFRTEMIPLSPEARAAIELVIFQNQGNIAKYMYGHQPGHRVFRIVFFDKEPSEWNFWRRKTLSIRRLFARW